MVPGLYLQQPPVRQAGCRDKYVEKIVPLMEVKLSVCIPLDPAGPRIRLPTLDFKSIVKPFRVNAVSPLENPKSPDLVCRLKLAIQPEAFAVRFERNRDSAMTTVPQQQHLMSRGRAGGQAEE